MILSIDLFLKIILFFTFYKCLRHIKSDLITDFHLYLQILNYKYIRYFLHWLSDSLHMLNNLLKFLKFLIKFEYHYLKSYTLTFFY